jgi:6-pyruvoyltetrahydropterin/6-carboxytetrahydropterin synthase
MPFDRHKITREIGIDMGHRVTFHGSKCKNLHGHRYTIEVTLEGPLARGGEQDGMVMDFGFIKDQMMAEIDTPCDHGLCLWIDDHIASVMLGPAYASVCREVEAFGHATYNVEPFGRLYLLHCVPTAENLARHWFERMSQAVHTDERNKGARVDSVRVWETPNCMAEYAPYRE